MSKRILSIFQYAFFLGAGLFLVWWQLKSMTVSEKSEFHTALKSANYWIAIPIAIMSILSHISRSMRWKLMLEPMDYHPKLRNVFAVTMIGYLANSAIPRLGELLRCTILAKYEKLKVDRLIGTIIIERSFDIICYVVFCCITLLIQMNLIGDYFNKELSIIGQNSGMPIWQKMLLVVSIIILIIALINFLAKKFPENKLVIKTANLIKGIGEGFRSVRKLKRRKEFLLHTIFIWSMYLGEIYLGFLAMDGIDNLSIKAAFSVLTLATLAMIATPGGIGSFPIFVMQTLIIYGINPTLGKAFGWVMWGVSTGIILIVGFISLLTMPYLNKDSNENINSNSEDI